MKLIRPEDFCEIVVDKFVEEGAPKGTRVYVAGHKALPISEEDPYTQRIKFLVHLVENKHVVFGPLYIVDPNSIKLVKPNEQKKLAKILGEDIEAVSGDINPEAFTGHATTH